MNRCLPALTGTLVLWSASWTQQPPTSIVHRPIGAEERKAAQDTPAEQYAALLSEYRPVSGGLRDAETDMQRKAHVEVLSTFPDKFLDLAERYPEDPIALEALRQAVQLIVSTDSAAQQTWEFNESHFPTVNLDRPVARTVSLVIHNHLQSEELGPIIDRMRYGYRMDFDECLSAVLEHNPHREVQALTCLTLAQFLNDRLRMVRLAEDRPELSECYSIVFGDHYLPDLRRRQDELASRIETLFERAVDYDDVRIRAGGTVAAQAHRELYEVRHLAIGHVAPEIDGTDQDGLPFRLSDYRGKVVLLYFWSEY